MRARRPQWEWLPMRAWLLARTATFLLTNMRLSRVSLLCSSSQTSHLEFHIRGWGPIIVPKLRVTASWDAHGTILESCQAFDLSEVDCQVRPRGTRRCDKQTPSGLFVVDLLRLACEHNSCIGPGQNAFFTSHMCVTLMIFFEVL